MNKPTLFIGSSTEGLKIAKAIQFLLDRVCEATIWSQGIFGLSRGYLEELVSSLEKFDFAILVLTPDDITISRELESQSPRDNVIFELGLFVGGIGRNRTYIVYERTKKIKSLQIYLVFLWLHLNYTLMEIYKHP
jgi:predicted nucleotide-binding protein